ncbi:lactate dehydrogenase [Halobacterium sp. DL1]|nr:lactate dehydrogenase [Halobacterium sp. DL1]
MTWSYQRTLLGLTMTAFFGTYVARLVVSPLIPDIMLTFDVSKSAVGLVLTGMWAAYAVMQFPSGILGEKYGERTIIVASLLLTGVGSLLLAAAPSFPAFALFGVFLGVGAGLYFPAAATLLTNRFENVGQALGFHNMGAPLAGLLTPVAAVFVATQFDWRVAITLGAVVAFPVAALYASRIRSSDSEHPDLNITDQFNVRSNVALLVRPSIGFTTTLAFLGVFVIQAIQSFFPTFLVEYVGTTQTYASVAFAVLFALQGITLPLVGRASDRFGRDRTIRACYVLGTAGLALFLVGDTVVHVVAVPLLSLGFSWPPAIQARFMDALRDDEQGVGFGLVRTVYMLLAALGSVVTGALATFFSWQVAYGVLAVIFAALAVLLTLNRVLGWDA